MNNELRKNLINRMIQIYGPKNPLVIEFQRLCENSSFSDKDLSTIVEGLEKH